MIVGPVLLNRLYRQTLSLRRTRLRAVTRFAIRILTAASAVVCMSCAAAPRHAAAQPPGFPDLSGFASVPVENYFVSPQKGMRYAHFSTPYNVDCSFAAAEPVPAWNGQAIKCDGEFPGLDNGSCVIGSAGAAGMGPAYAVSRTDQPCGAHFTHGNLLNIGQKLNYRNATCAVGADHLVACLDTTRGDHGFVLKPSGNLAF